MPLPAGWPPRPATDRRSIRFFKAGTGTADFADNAYLFSDSVTGANTFVPLPYVQAGSNTPVTLGGNPSGTGQNMNDANLLAAPGAQEVPKAMIWCQTMRVCNDGSGVLEFSFDGTNVHGQLKAGESVIYRVRFEAGIALRGNGNAFRVEAW